MILEFEEFDRQRAARRSIVSAAGFGFKRGIGLGLALAISFAGLLQAEPLTLSAAVQSVLSRSAAAAAARAQADAARDGLSAARAAYLPEVALNGAYTHGDNPVYSFGTLLGQSRFEMGDFSIDKLNHPSAVDNLQGQAALHIQILNGQRGSQVAAARAASGAAGEYQRAVQQILIGQTVESYYGLVLSRELLNALKERIEESEAEIANATRLKDQGLVLGSDYHLARSVLGRLKLQRAEAEAQADAARSALNIMMGKSDEDPIDSTGSLDDAGLGAWAQPDLAALERDLPQHPLLRNAQYRADAARDGARAESRYFWPVLSGFSQLEGNGHGLDRGGWNHLSGVKLGIPVFSPGLGSRSDARAAEARQMDAAKSLLEDRMKIDLRRKHRDYLAAQQRLELARSTEEEARNALVQFKKLYRAGRQSIADVLQGEANLAQSQADLLRVRHDLRAGYAQVLLAAGTLDRLPAELER